MAVAADTRTPVGAIHVHHGLSANADDWARFCGEFCAARRVPLTVRKVDVERGPRISVEAAARDSRYAALERAATEQRALAVLFAHHADDQAETMLLQLFRGAGPRGEGHPGDDGDDANHANKRSDRYRDEDIIDLGDLSTDDTQRR